jgi:hypothetical protein
MQHKPARAETPATAETDAIFFTGTASHREQQKTTNPKPSDGQVYPIARSLPVRHPNVHTNQLGFYPEVLSCAVLGKSTVLDSPHLILIKPFCR